MNNKETLERLEALFRAKEVTDGFPSKEAALSWGNKVAPLLRFNQQLHQTFLHYQQIIHHDVSSYTAAPAFRTMLSQVEMAIETLKIDTASSSAVQVSEPVVKTKLWRRAKEKCWPGDAMSDKEIIRILELAKRNALPDKINDNSVVSLAVVKELYQGKYLSGINASGANAMCYLNLQITVRGRDYLKKLKQERIASRIKKSVFAAIGTIVTALIIAWLSKYLGLTK